MLNLILQSPDFMVDAEGFQGTVLDYIKELSVKANQTKTHHEKNRYFI